MGMYNSFDEAAAKERHRRGQMNKRHHPYHYWSERGDLEPPAQEFWCDQCVGFYGVPHTDIHADFAGNSRSCPSLGRAMAGERQCACLECVVAESLVRA